MYSVVITYGQPTDAAAFDKHYAETHIPLASALPGLLSYTVTKLAGLGGESKHYMIATLQFDDEAAALAALGSPEGQAAGADIANFATGGADLAGGVTSLADELRK